MKSQCGPCIMVTKGVLASNHLNHKIINGTPCSIVGLCGWAWAKVTRPQLHIKWAIWDRAIMYIIHLSSISMAAFILRANLSSKCRSWVNYRKKKLAYKLFSVFFLRWMTPLLLSYWIMNQLLWKYCDFWQGNL